MMGKERHRYDSFEERIADINSWLKDNKHYASIVRSPVASSVGIGLYRIKEIDPQLGDSFIIHPAEVKERFEGDHDHDQAHVVWLDDEFYQELKPHIKKTKGLGISKYVRTSPPVFFGDLSGGVDIMRNMTYGETAIGEVVNIARAAGVLNSMLGKKGSLTFTVNGKERKIKVRPLDMKIKDSSIHLDDGTTFNGPFREWIRLHLQAALDHPKLLLLNDWGYNKRKLLEQLFYDPKDPTVGLSKDVDLLDYINWGIMNEVLRLNQEIANQRDGVGRSIKFDELFEKSTKYARFVENRDEFLQKLYKEESVQDIDEKYNVVSEGQTKSVVEFIKGDFKEGSNRPTSLQEFITVILDRMVDFSGEPYNRWFDVPDEISRAVHISAINEVEHEVILSLVEEDPNANWEKAMEYAQTMSDALYGLFKQQREAKVGSDPTIENIELTEEQIEENSQEESDAIDIFIKKMSSKSWDYSDTFIDFYEEWSEKFSELSEIEQGIATMSFLIGMAHGRTGTQRLNLRMLPPVKREQVDINGNKINKTTLNPDIVKIYFEKYNELLDEAYRDSARLQQMKNEKPILGYNKMKEAFNCG